jgi:hypothetical protein
LCGSGTHPGGGVMGANGHNAAQVVIADLNGTAAPMAQRVGPAPKSGVIERAMETVMETKTGKKLGYTVATSPALRRVVKFAARSKSSR